jgi:hypothetical protein
LYDQRIKSHLNQLIIDILYLVDAQIRRFSLYFADGAVDFLCREFLHCLQILKNTSCAKDKKNRKINRLIRYRHVRVYLLLLMGCTTLWQGIDSGFVSGSTKQMKWI